jgi:V/A-type H+-transporting ATPase subunit C
MFAPRRSDAYLATRVSLLAQRLLDDRTLEAMADQPLANIPTLQGLQEMLDSPMDGGQRSRTLENLLIGALLSELSILVRPLQGGLRELFLFWARRFELFNLKALIRGKLQGLPPGVVQDNLYDLPPYTRLPRASLLQAESVTELLKLLEATPYGDIARQARLAFEARREALYLDATIDRRYFYGLVQRTTPLEARHRESLERLVRTQVDHQNLIWLLRYRFAYGLSPAETYYVLVPRGLRLDRRKLQELCNLGDFETVLEQLPPQLARTLSGSHTAVEVERRLEAVTIALARHELRHADSAPARAFAYLLLREVDLKRMQALIQGKLLELPATLIREALGTTPDALGNAA